MNNPKNKYVQTIEKLTSDIERILDENEDTYGLSIALVNDKGLIWGKGFGYTDHTKKEQVTAETLFSTQSIGKTFTATAFLIMASKGLINLDDPVRKYYPEFTINTIHGKQEEEIAKITFRRILNHRAGFTHIALVGNEYTDSGCTFEEHVQSISKGWLKSPVGSEMSYANNGYDLTGYVMGLVKNKSFEEVMEEELFQPLDISAATFKIEEALKQSFARGYDGKYTYPVVQVPMLPSGGMYVSVIDVAKFVSFHLRKGKIDNKQIIDLNLFEEMYKPQFVKDKEFGYGLGIYSSEKIGNAKVYGHAGGGYGYQTIMLWVPDFKVGVIVLSNYMKYSRVGGIARKALGLMIDEKRKPKAKPVNVELLRRLEGTYCADDNLPPQITRISYEEGKLVVYYTNGSEAELYPQSSTEFLSKDGIKYKFELDKEERPLSVYIDNPVFPYKAKYNDGPNDKPGPNKREWQECLGIYQYQEDGRPNYLGLSVINGYLYLIFGDNLKLHHYENNIYFTADGEVLTLHKDELNYKSIPAKKIELDLNQIIESIKLSKIKYDFYRGAISSLVNILNTIEGFDQALDLIEKVIRIDKEFKGNYSSLGNRLYASGKLKEAKICFTKLLEIDRKNRKAEEMLNKISQ